MSFCYPTHNLQTKLEIESWLNVAKNNGHEYWVKAFESQLRRWNARKQETRR